MEHEMFSLQGSVYCSFPLQVSYGIIFHWTTSKEEKCRKIWCFFFRGPVGLTFSSLRNFCTRYKPPGLTNAVRGGDEVKICKNCWNVAAIEKNEKTLSIFESTKNSISSPNFWGPRCFKAYDATTWPIVIVKRWRRKGKRQWNTVPIV